MTAGVSVIVRIGEGGQPILRTADSLARQSTPPADVWLAPDIPRPEPPPAARSVATRLGAVLLDMEPSSAAVVNTAARRASGELLAIVPSGYALDPSFLEASTISLERSGNVAGLAPSIVLHNPDGRASMRWQPSGLDVVTALANPRSVPPALVVRHSVWDALGGFDDALPDLVLYEFWLRLLLARHSVALLATAGLSRDVTLPEPAPANDSAYLTAFRTVLEKHHAAVEEHMEGVLIAREAGFGLLREQHRALVARRDADLSELDAVRAETAHHQAFLEHHGGEAFDWGDFRRLDPISRDWGYDRGVPIDRRHIEDFLASHSSDVRGRVLEVQEDDFTRAFGGPRVTASAVLDIDARNARATVLADLRGAPELPSDHFDCLILTQTLHVIDDVRAALSECHRILQPGGVLLATLPTASRVCLEYGAAGDFWRVTPAGARALVEPVFGPGSVQCDAYGNVLTNTAFLHGLGCHELSGSELETYDPYFPALTGIRARKTAVIAGRRSGSGRGLVLLYHRVEEAADVHDLAVPSAVFESHLRWLKDECEVLPLDEMLSSAASGLPERAIAVTFDDGYTDNLRAAALLQHQGVPAAFFLTSRWLEVPGEYWWDALERILLGPTPVPPVLEVPVPVSRRLPTATPDERRAAHWQLHDLLVHAAVEDRERAIAVVRAWSGGAAASCRPMLADEVRELARLPGMAIGAHTVNHPALPDQPAAARAQEIAECRDALARVTGRPVGMFAYPYGAVDRDTAGLVRSSCRWGLTCDETSVGESFDAARIPRLDVKPWPVEEFASRVTRLLTPEAAPAIRTTTVLL